MIEVWAYNIETILADKIETIYKKECSQCPPKRFLWCLHSNKSTKSMYRYQEI